MSAQPVELPQPKWWHCHDCDVHWWGGPVCWACDTDLTVSPNARPRRVGEVGAINIIRPEWSNQP